MTSLWRKLIRDLNFLRQLHLFSYLPHSFFSYVDNKGKDDEEKILEEEVEPAPVRRIMKLNTKEWPYLLSGSVAAIINGLFPFAFALLLSEILFVSESIFFLLQSNLNSIAKLSFLSCKHASPFLIVYESLVFLVTCTQWFLERFYNSVKL